MVRTRCLILLAAIALGLAGCATHQLDPRDPEIYRPVNPRYVLPEK